MLSSVFDSVFSQRFIVVTAGAEMKFCSTCTFLELICWAVPGTKGFWEPLVLCDLHLLHIKILYLNYGFFVLNKDQLHFSNYETNVGRKQIREFRFCYFSRTDLSESDSIKVSRFRFAHAMENCCH